MAGTAKTLELSELAGWAEASAARAEGFDVQPALRDCSILLQGASKQNINEGHGPDGTPYRPLLMPRVRGGTKPLYRDAILFGSLTAGARGNVEQVSADQLVYGSNLDYAAIQQEGGTIQAAPGKALAIPLTSEALRAGSPRNFGRPLLLLLWKRGQSSGVLVDRREAHLHAARGARHFKRNREATRHYLLVKKVTIPARPFVGFNAAIADGCSSILADHLARRLAS